MTRSLQYEAEYPHPVEQVWRALTEPGRMGLWIMNFDNDEGEMTADFRPVVGTTYRLEARKGRGWRGYVVGQVLEVVPNKRLVYTWAHSASQDAHPVRIEFTLEPIAMGTRLRMVQSGYPDGVKGWFTMKMGLIGWKKMLGSSILPVLDAAESAGPPPPLNRPTARRDMLQKPHGELRGRPAPRNTWSKE